jgi:hypothetical protein
MFCGKWLSYIHDELPAGFVKRKIGAIKKAGIRASGEGQILTETTQPTGTLGQSRASNRQMAMKTAFPSYDAFP